MRKSFIITVDTEGDNGWGYHDGDVVKTENTLYIPRFQELCEKYSFKPVYLTNYEMICDDRFVGYIKPKALAGLCEIGIHVHAWNNPPLCALDRNYGGNPYLIEYPADIMRKKFAVTYNLIKERIGIAPVSHRAGRWVMNDEYFRILEEFNILVDCSVTPGISWAKSPGATVAGGSDYSLEKNSVKKVGSVLEVPVTIAPMRSGTGSPRTRIKYLLKGRKVWLRPAVTSIDDMKKIVKQFASSDFVEFMIHSSELMPGCSPFFKDETSIEQLYSDMDELFLYARKKGYDGVSLKDYRYDY